MCVREREKHTSDSFLVTVHDGGDPPLDSVSRPRPSFSGEMHHTSSSSSLSYLYLLVRIEVRTQQTG